MSNQFRTLPPMGAEPRQIAEVVSSRGKQTFTITHANNSQSDRTFKYVVIG
jgi:hypothetical protein